MGAMAALFIQNSCLSGHNTPHGIFIRCSPQRCRRLYGRLPTCLPVGGRNRVTWVPIGKDYRFVTDEGSRTLRELIGLEVASRSEPVRARSNT
jgi:hypothetical protein